MAQTAHEDACRFKLPHGVKGMSRIHEDLSTSYHQPGRSAARGRGCNMLRRALPIGRKLHVGIVGGGVAGLRCADVLLAHGVQVTIVEGRNRLGGRLGQGTMMGKHLVDLGPNWIHGTENNPMIDLAAETGTTTHAWGENQIMFDEDRRVLSRDETAEVQEFVWEMIKEAFDESNDKYARDARDRGIAASANLGDFFAERIRARYGGDGGPEAVAKMRIVEQTSKMWGAFVGQATERQSLRFFWLEECLEGSNLFCADSYYKILQRLMAPVVGAADIKFDSRVTKIRAKTGTMGVARSNPSIVYETSRSPHGSKRPAEEMDDGVEQAFDELVVTTPLGWLQRNLHAFEPRLPKRLSSAVSALGYGNLDKVYISFPSAFWNEPLQPGASVSPTPAQQSVPNTTATTAPIRQPSASTSDSLLASDPNFAGFASFLEPNYAEATNPMRTNQELLNFAALPGACAQPTLLFYIYGAFAEHVARLVSQLPDRTLDGPADPVYIAALWELFEPYVAQLPNYSSAMRPVDVLATAWVNDELAGNGSYTNFPVGVEEADDDVEALRAGLPERGVWFAGEHTAPFVALGTVTGAYWSGEGVARRILSAYGMV